jgi:histidine triad (HIT) family protein
MTIFSKIIKGEIPSHKIYEDDKYFSFLDINPIQPGHTLVIPKKEVDDVFDLDDETYKGLWLTCKKIAPAIKKATNAQRIGVKIVGLEVPHAHIHLIPINSLLDIEHKNAKKGKEEELKQIAEKIREEL